MNPLFKVGDIEEAEEREAHWLGLDDVTACKTLVQTFRFIDAKTKAREDGK